MVPQFIPDDQAPEMSAEMAAHLHCFICGNDDAYALRVTQESLTDGKNTVLVTIKAAFCRFCGERVMDLCNNHRLDVARAQLARGEFDDFTPVGTTYQAS